MLPRIARRLNNIQKFYEPMVPALKALLEQGLTQTLITHRLNEMGFETIGRGKITQPMLSRLIVRMRASGKLPLIKTDDP